MSEPTSYNKHHHKILRIVADHRPSIDRIELLNLACHETKDPCETDDRIDALIHRGALKQRGNRIYFGSNGVIYLDAFEHLAEQQAQQEKQKRFSNKLDVAELFVSAITFVGGILVEHFAQVVDFVVELFR